MRSSFFYLVFTAALISSTALAEKRPDVTKMTCRDATEVVERWERVVLTTGKHTFNRFVSQPFFCPADEFAHATSVSTVDRPQCQIGYTCSRHEASNGGSTIIGASVTCRDGDTRRFDERTRDSFVIGLTEFVCRQGRWKKVDI